MLFNNMPKLDPEERIRFRNLLSEMSRQDVIIILSTHIVGDISSTCNSMALLNLGELAFKGAPEGLLAKSKDHVFLIDADDVELESIRTKYPVISTIPSESGWEVKVVADKIDDFQVRNTEPNLEDAYVYYMEYILGNKEEFRNQESGVRIGNKEGFNPNP